MSNVTTHTHFQAFEDEVAELSNETIGKSRVQVQKESDWEDATAYSQEDVFAQLSNYGGFSHDYA